MEKRFQELHDKAKAARERGDHAEAKRLRLELTNAIYRWQQGRFRTKV